MKAIIMAAIVTLCAWDRVDVINALQNPVANESHYGRRVIFLSLQPNFAPVGENITAYALPSDYSYTGMINFKVWVGSTVQNFSAPCVGGVAEVGFTWGSEDLVMVQASYSGVSSKVETAYFFQGSSPPVCSCPNVPPAIIFIITAGFATFPPPLQFPLLPRYTIIAGPYIYGCAPASNSTCNGQKCHQTFFAYWSGPIGIPGVLPANTWSLLRGPVQTKKCP